MRPQSNNIFLRFHAQLHRINIYIYTHFAQFEAVASTIQAWLCFNTSVVPAVLLKNGIGSPLLVALGEFPSFAQNNTACHDMFVWRLAPQNKLVRLINLKPYRGQFMGPPFRLAQNCNVGIK